MLQSSGVSDQRCYSGCVLTGVALLRDELRAVRMLVHELAGAAALGRAAAHPQVADMSHVPREEPLSMALHGHGCRCYQVWSHVLVLATAVSCSLLMAMPHCQCDFSSAFA